MKEELVADELLYVRNMFINSINSGYEHFGYEGDYELVFNDKSVITVDDVRRYEQLCTAFNSKEFYAQLHNNAVMMGIADIDIYEQCLKNHINEGNALPYVISIMIMGRRDKSIDNAVRKELIEYLKNRSKQYESSNNVSDNQQDMLLYKKTGNVKENIEESTEENAKGVKDKNEPYENNVKDYIDNKKKEETFSQAIMRLIDESGQKDAEVYKKAYISKETFSNIRKGSNASKMKALQLCVALELDINQTREILSKDGVALGNNISDYIFEFFIKKRIYDLNKIDEALFDYGCKTISKKD